MLFKCCLWYASRCGKFSSGHRTGKGQFSLQSQRKSMPNNAQTTIQLHSHHMLVRLSSKSFECFSRMWTEYFQRYKLGLEKAEEPFLRFQRNQRIKLPTFSVSWRKQGSSRNISTSVSLITLKPLCGSPQTWKILQEMGIPDHLTCLLRKLYTGQEATVELDTEQQTGFKLGKEYV